MKVEKVSSWSKFISGYLLVYRFLSRIQFKLFLEAQREEHVTQVRSGIFISCDSTHCQRFLLHLKVIRDCYIGIEICA